MRQIALVADLHGNLPATLALERDLRARRVDDIWCLGDIVGKGPSSADTFDWAMANCSLILRGNWDEGIGARMFAKNDSFYIRQLGEKRMQKLLEFPLEHHALLSGRRVRLLHGRPVMQTLQTAWEDNDALQWLFQPDFTVVGYADAHRAALRVMRFDGLLFNTGSVGNGLGMPVVQYAILRCQIGGDPAPFDVSLVMLPYDNQQAVRDARACPELPHQNAYILEVTQGVYGRVTPAPPV